MHLRVTALDISPHQRQAVTADFSANSLCANDPLKPGRPPQIIWALGRMKAPNPEPQEFIPVPKHERNRKPQKMIRNPNWESGFKLANTQ